ncbi:MAG: hypothetical protein ACT4PO_10065 [Actinomycetota bacterium]
MRRRVLVTAIVVLAVVVVPAAAALAHEGEEEVPAKTMIDQAIALIRSQPDQTDAIEDKIKDALEAEDAEGVDLDLVREAQSAFESGDLARTELLLEQAIGARPGEPVVSPNPGPRTPPPSTSAPPPPEHLRSLDQNRLGGVQAAVLLGVAGVLALAGLGIVRKFR